MTSSAALRPNPVVELNRAVAVAMVNGPQPALAELDKLSRDPRLRASCYLPAVRAPVLEQALQHAAACARGAPRALLSPGNPARPWVG